MRPRFAFAAAALFSVAGSACSQFDPDPAPNVIHARFDPDAKVIPMPSDVLRDAATGLLELPADDADLSDAERALYAYLNTLDGWSSASAASVEFTAPIDPASVDDATLSVWKWNGPTLEPVAGARVTIADEPAPKIAIDAPRTGWERGARYAVVLRGGEGGARGAAGERLECDAAFYFLRQTERLDTGEHDRAFPGDTAEERHANAVRLEEIRADLAPAFDFFDARGLPRAEVAALWQFTVTTRVELAMDKASQRMPLPIQLLIDPDTNRVDLPASEWDSEVEREAKRRLAAYDGFATSANLLFELTGPVDPSSVDGDAIEVWHLADPARRIPADAVLMDDGIHVVVTPASLPLPERAQFAVVATDRMIDTDGRPVIAMPAGALIGGDAPVIADGVSTVGVVADEDAVRLEATRAMLHPIWRVRDRGGVAVAWPFRTQTIVSRLEAMVSTAETLAAPIDPTITVVRTPGQAVADFPLGIGSLLDVDRVVEGTIASPYFLDAETRAWREDGGHVVDDVAFTAVVPDGVVPGSRIPVVIFGHGVMTERRFVLAIGDALARRGIASVAIDLPYHGTRTHCLHGGPISLVDPTTGDLTSLPPCRAGATCRADGKCVGPDGDDMLAQWPVLGYPVASGAAFLEIEHIANTKDHFDQAMVDLGALARSLREGEWSGVFGAAVDPDRVYYAGQSLGGILGATFLAVMPEIQRAVLNVPGADLVDMFGDSTWFGPQVDGFFTREGIARGSYEAERFLDVARWFVDAVDPLNLGARTGDRALMLQMATLDFIIPNAYTERLEDVTGAPRRDYIAEHGFLVIPIEPEYLRGATDLARFLNGELQP
jgi:hypothetical protein